MMFNSIAEKPSPSEVRIGRLERKLLKLQERLAVRDKQLKVNDDLMKMHPWIKPRIDSFTKHLAEIKDKRDLVVRIRELEQRCTEQAELIVLLRQRRV